MPRSSPGKEKRGFGDSGSPCGGENPPLTYSRYANVDPASLRGRLMRSPGGAEEEWTRAPQPFFVIPSAVGQPTVALRQINERAGTNRR